MGFCFDDRGRLCCDACPTSGGVRKMKCPWGYCYPVALCAECRKKHKDKLGKKFHREQGCEQKHFVAVRENAERKAKLDAGKLILASAVGLHDGSGIVRVTFIKLVDGSHVSETFLMHENVYDKRDTMGHTPTLDDFQKVGEVKQDVDQSPVVKTLVMVKGE